MQLIGEYTLTLERRLSINLDRKPYRRMRYVLILDIEGFPVLPLYFDNQREVRAFLKPKLSELQLFKLFEELNQ